MSLTARLLNLILLSFVSACGSQNPQIHNETKLEYVKLKFAESKRLTHVIKKPITIKLNGDLSLTHDELRQQLLYWLEPMRELSNEVTDTIEIKEAAEQFDMQISYRDREGRAFTDALENHIYLYKNYKKSTLLHEIGHLFGLADTYVEGTWECKRGEAPSIMCNANYSVLQADDLAGIKNLYCDSFPQDCSELPAEKLKVYLKKAKIGFEKPSGSLVCPDASQEDAIFNCDSACNIRAKPGKQADNPVIATVRVGERFEVHAHACQKSTGYIWYQIDYLGTLRWVWSLRYF
ncbi:MAG: hypothetical protein KBD78_04500 [Oligoflexales bacterium]|nr:hypothetical protein [Oligoflexales bacterium]